MRLSHVNPSLLAVVAEGFLSRLSFGIIGFALPLYALHLGMSLTAIGFLVSLNVATEMALKPVMGSRADRFGLKRSLSFAIGLRSLVGFLLALSWSPWQLYGIRMVHGAAESLRDPSVNAIIAERADKKAVASAFAWYATAKNVAASVGKAVAGILLTVTLGNYALVFLIAFLLSALPLYAVVRYVNEEGVNDHAAGKLLVAIPAAVDTTGARSSADSRGTWVSILPFVGMGALISGTAAMVSNLFPILATKYAGLSEAEAGIIYAVSTCVIIFAGPLFGWLSDNVSRRLVLMVRSIANTLSSLIYIVAPSFAGVATAKVVDDMGKAAFRPAWGALMTHISSFDRARRARTMGYLGLGENVGEVAGPFLAGFLWHTWGVTVVLVVRAGLAVVTEVYAMCLPTSQEKLEEDRSAAHRAEKPGSPADGRGATGQPAEDLEAKP